MLWIKALFAVCIIWGAGTSVNQVSGCGINQCDSDVQFLNTVLTLSSDLVFRRLKLFCSVFMNPVKCLNEKVAECLEEEDIEVLSFIQFPVAGHRYNFSEMLILLRNLEKMGTELCRENSELHADYVESINCILDQPLSSYNRCFLKAKLHYARYDARQGLNGDGQESLTKRYTLGCFSEYLRNQCGDAASRTYLAIIQKTGFLKLGTINLSNMANSTELKQGFLNMLDMDEVKRARFSPFFERRRK